MYCIAPKTRTQWRSLLPKGLFALQVYEAQVASSVDKQPTVGLPGVVSSAPVVTASLQQLPVGSLPLEAHKPDSCIQPAAAGYQSGFISAPSQAAKQVVSSLCPLSQAFHTPSLPLQPLSVLSSGAAAHLSAEMNTSALPSGPAMPTATCAATAGAPASGAISAAVATLPACPSASEPAADTDRVCTSATLLPATASSAAARLADSPQAQFPGDPRPPSGAEQLLPNDPVTSAPVSGLLLEPNLLDPAAGTPPLQTGHQGGSSTRASRLPLRPASTAGTAVMASPVPALPSPTATVQPAIPSAATAGQQAAAEEAAAPAPVTHMGPPVDDQPHNASVQQQHGDAPDQHQHRGVLAQRQQANVPGLYQYGGVHANQQLEGEPADYQYGSVHANQQLEGKPAQKQHHNAGGGQEGKGDLLYEHLAAVLATVPALRDRVLTFAPLHGQVHFPGTGKPRRGAGQSSCLVLCCCEKSRLHHANTLLSQPASALLGTQGAYIVLLHSQHHRQLN